MNKNNRKVSEAQKAAQKRYDKEKTKMLSVKYTPKDMRDYDNFKRYIESTGDSANQVIKELIHQFLKNRNRGGQYYISGSKSENIHNDAMVVYPYKLIKRDNIEFLYANFNIEDVEYILDQYKKIFQQEIFNEKAKVFNTFIENVVPARVLNNTKLSTKGKGIELIRLFDRYVRM